MSHWLERNTINGPTNWKQFIPVPGVGEYAGQPKTNDITYGKNRYLVNSFTDITRLLAGAGVPGNIVPWAAAQVMLETKGLTSNVSKKDLNLSGITWINKPYQDATKGSPRPRSEGGNYAHFASYSKWAKDFKRILSIGPNAPIDATSLDDYVNRLHNNHYFMSNPALYLQGIKMILAAAPPLQKQQQKEIQDAKDKTPPHLNWWQKLPTWAKVTAGLGAALVAVKLIKD